MRLPSLNPNYRAALVLMIIAGILVMVASLTNRGDFTSAALVIAGLVCLLTGIFFITISGSDPIDLRYMSLLPVQSCINLTRACADLGIQGNACIIPKGRDGRTRVMQFLPVTTYGGEPLPMDSFVTGPNAAGFLMEPSSAPLFTLLSEKDHMAIPGDMKVIHGLIRELGVDILDIAKQVSSTNDNDIITVVMHEYRLIDGCRAAFSESPRVCTANPCPVCSLFATIFAEGTGNIIQLERCAPDPKKATVTAVFSALPE